MVRALIDGTKTQTRRLVKPQPVTSGSPSLWAWHGAKAAAFWTDGARIMLPYCPYGVPGDRLWVKETFRVDGWDEDGFVYVTYGADGSSGVRDFGGDDIETFIEKQTRRLRRAGGKWMQRGQDGEPIEANGTEDECFISLPEGKHAPWIPSIFMPRWASRITSDLTDVRVQRLHDISEEDARAEGVEPFDGTAAAAVYNYARLWNEINGEGAWALNPWVWALTFKRVEQSAVRGAA